MMGLSRNYGVMSGFPVEVPMPGSAPDLLMGVDPGVGGGVCVMDYSGAIVGLYPMPETESETAELLAEFAPRVAAVALERVGPMPKQGISSTSVFMQQYGFLKGVLTVLQIRRENPTPQTWQKALGIPTRAGKTQSQHKAGLRQKAQQLWPVLPKGMKVSNKTADAALICEWLRRSLK